jgi:succinoglycan biosynthesis transport protein ExoP
MEKQMEVRSGIRRHRDGRLSNLTSTELEHARPRTGETSEYLAVLKRNRLLIVGCVLACGLGSLLLTLTSPTLYRSTTTLEIKGLNDNILNTRALDPSVPSVAMSADSFLQTQMELLRSRALVSRVVQRLHLDEVATSAPEPQSLLQNLRHAVRYGNAPQAAPTERQAAVAAALSHLKINGFGATRLVEISFESPKPQLAADFLNVLTSEYLLQDFEQRSQASESTSKWLASELRELKRKVEQSDIALLAYASQHGIVYMDGKNNVVDEKLRQLQAELSKAQAERMMKQSRLESANSASPGSIPDVLDSPLLRDQQAKLGELKREYADLSTVLTPNHYKAKRVEAQIREIEQSIEKRTREVEQRIATEFDAAKRQEDYLSAAYQQQSALVLAQASKAVRYGVLKGEADSERQLYESMLQKVKEASMATGVRTSVARVVDAAEPPTFPSKPNVPLNTGVGLASGLLLGVVFAFFRAGSDTRLRQPGEARELFGVQELGVIPVGGRHRLFPGRPSNLDLRQSEPMLPMDHEWVSAAATSIRFATDAVRGSSSRVLVLTSANPGEGKTTATAQLGMSLAAGGESVLLVDGDMRRSRLHKIFGLAKAGGLSELMADQKTIEGAMAGSVIRRTRVPGLSVLTAGVDSNEGGQLLNGDRLGVLIKYLRRQFNWILIDAPPMLQLCDARVLARHADAAILLVRSEQTTRDAVAIAVQRLEEDGIMLLGVILNHWKPGSSSPYYESYRKYVASSVKSS